MGLPADMRGQKEWAVPPRRFRMPGKKVARTEQADEARPKQEQPEMDRYLLQVDRQTKRSFKTAEAARSAALEIKTRVRGRPRKRHVPDSLSTAAEDMLASAQWRTVSWRSGTKGRLKARFAAVRCVLPTVLPSGYGTRGSSIFQ